MIFAYYCSMQRYKGKFLKNGGVGYMNDNNEKTQADINRQRLINKAVLLTVSVLDGKGFCFGKNKIGSVLKGHKYKYILDNRLDSIDTYGLLKGIDFKEIAINMDKLIQHGYLAEKHPDQINSEFTDDSGNAVYLTNKGREKVKSISSEELVGEDSGYDTAVKPKPDYSIPEIVSALANESGNYMGIFQTEHKYRVMHTYFGRSDTMEGTGKLFGVSRERVRQIIQKEIMRLNRSLKVEGELSQINAFILEKSQIDSMAVFKQVYGKDALDSVEAKVFVKITNYMLKSKGYRTFMV